MFPGHSHSKLQLNSCTGETIQNPAIILGCRQTSEVVSVCECALVIVLHAEVYSV